MIGDYLYPSSYIPAKKDKQLANHISTSHDDLLNHDVVIAGLGLHHESYLFHVRNILSRLYHKHIRIRIADAGNIIPGISYADTLVALDDLLSEFAASDARVIFLAEDELMAQTVWKKILQLHPQESTFVGNMQEDTEELILEIQSQKKKGSYFNLAAFQNYLNDPDLLESNEAIGGELLRLGLLRERPDAMEAALRRSGSCFFHTNSVKSSEWNLSLQQPNGLNAAEACKIFHYMGFSSALKWSVAGPYHGAGDALMAQLLWHFIDGANNSREENPASAGNDFLKFYVEQEKENHHFIFYQSKFTYRWWMQVDHPHKESENTKDIIVPCTEQDYKKAVNGESPDAWWLVNRRY